MNTGIYRDLDNLYESIESLNNKIRRQERELELTYKGIEQLNNIIHNAIEYIEHTQNYGKEKVLYVNGNDILKILKGETK